MISLEELECWLKGELEKRKPETTPGYQALSLALQEFPRASDARELVLLIQTKIIDQRAHLDAKEAIIREDIFKKIISSYTYEIWEIGRETRVAGPFADLILAGRSIKKLHKQTGRDYKAVVVDSWEYREARGIKA